MASALFPGMLIIETNATFSSVLTYFQSDGVTPVNLTGFTAKMDVKAITPDDTIIVSLTTTNGFITLGGALGTITLGLPYATASTLPPGVYEFDLCLVSGTNHERLINGSIQVIQGTTP